MKGKNFHDSTHEQYGLVWYPHRTIYRGVVKLYYRAKIQCPCCGKEREIRKNVYVDALRNKRHARGRCQSCAGKKLSGRERDPKRSLPKLVDNVRFSANINGLGYKVKSKE